MPIATITISSTGAISVSPDPISAVPGQSVVFEIQNNDNTKHRVSVLTSEFKKKKNNDKDDPMDLFVIFWTDVESNDVGAIVHHIRPGSHFGTPNGHKHEYKYTIHSSNGKLDPDIDINN